MWFEIFLKVFYAQYYICHVFSPLRLSDYSMKEPTCNFMAWLDFDQRGLFLETAIECLIAAMRSGGVPGIK